MKIVLHCHCHSIPFHSVANIYASVFDAYTWPQAIHFLISAAFHCLASCFAFFDFVVVTIFFISWSASHVLPFHLNVFFSKLHSLLWFLSHIFFSVSFFGLIFSFLFRSVVSRFIFQFPIGSKRSANMMYTHSKMLTIHTPPREIFSSCCHIDPTKEMAEYAFDSHTILPKQCR